MKAPASATNVVPQPVISGGGGPVDREAQVYRPDIDGLRALAVLPILFNHVGLRGFGGGYVGVDIFFVISGYLITAILVRDIAAGRYSIAQFYRRRVLRIFPALFVMLAVTSGLAVVAMLPGELDRYARSLGATTLFGSNILFYFESGYFDSASHSKPLLHTWSLAIEEQFYILWPLLIAWAVPRGRALPAMLVIAVLSFAIAVWLVRADMSAAFYLLPSRAWELALGGMIAVITVRPRARLVREALSVLAIAMLAYAFWRFSNLTPFPGFAALVPCAASAILIWSGPGTWVGRALSLPPLLFVGLISYSLYLWHWPVIVFAEIWLMLPDTLTTMIIEIVVSMVLAVLSWRYVEQPLRHGAAWPVRRVVASGGAVMAVMIATATLLVASGGLPDRYSQAQVAMAAYADRDYEAMYRRGSCFVYGAYDTLPARCLSRARPDRPHILLLGDSQAAHLWPGFAAQGARYDVAQATIIGCRPALYPVDSDARCARFYRDILTRWVPEAKPDLIVLAGRWQKMDLPVIESTLAELAAGPTPVLLVGPMPDYTAALPRLLVLADRRGDPALIRRAESADIRDTDAAMRRVAQRHGISYSSAITRFCPGGRACRTLADADVPLQFDYGHLTTEGSALIVRGLSADIDAALASREKR